MNRRLSHWKMIAAIGPRNEIGLRSTNSLPWSIPSEFQHFLDTTRGSTLIVGRRTFESMFAADPVPHSHFRKVVVLTRKNYQIEHSSSNSNGNEEKNLIEFMPSLADAVKKYSNSSDSTSVWVAGGESVYREAMPLVSELLLTEVRCYTPRHEHRDDSDLILFPMEAALREFGKERRRLVRDCGQYVIWSLT